MFFVIALGIFFVIVAGTWFMGTWNIFLNLIITILAATLATSFFEVVATMIQEQDPSYTYFADFLGLWIVFGISFVILRVMCEVLTKYKLKMNLAVELLMRTGLSMTNAWIFICFAFFTLHTAPLPVEGGWGSFQDSPESRNLGIGPDRLWMSYAQSRSRGALSEFKDPLFLEADKREDHPDDEGMNCRVFDPFGDYIFKYRHRRDILATEESIRISDE